MKKCAFAIVAALALFGCRSVTVKNYGQSVVRVNGKDQIVSNGWYVSHWQHWMITKADSVKAGIKPDDISFEINGLDEKSDGDGLSSVVDKSLSGAATLASKIGAAIATAGGSSCADGVVALIQNFIKAGGDASKASVSVKDGAVTLTDGVITCTGDGCSE